MSSLGDGTFTLVAENAAENSQGELINLEYEVKLVKRFPQPGTQGYSGLPAIDPTNSFQFNLGGKKSRITLEFIIYNDGTDKSNGTFDTAATINDPRLSGTTIETVEEQEIWLDEYINDADLQVSYRLYGPKYTDRVNTGEGTPIVITEARPEPVAERPTSTRYIVQANIGRRVI